MQLSHVNASFSPRVEDLLSKLKDSSPLRLTFHQAARRGYKYINTIMERHQKQWQFYKEVRVLNPRNIPDLDLDVSCFSSLCLPTEKDAFAAKWQRYSRVENVFPSFLRQYSPKVAIFANALVSETYLDLCNLLLWYSFGFPFAVRVAFLLASWSYPTSFQVFQLASPSWFHHISCTPWNPFS